MKKYKKEPKDRTVRIDQEEYSALCELRDTLYAETVAKFAKLQNSFQDLLAVNREQLERLLKQDRALDQHRISLEYAEKREKLLTARNGRAEVKTETAP